MDHCVLMWMCVSRPVGGTPALSPLLSLPPSLLFLSFPSPFSVFLLSCDSITPHSSSLSLFLSRTNALSHHCFSSLRSLSLSHTHTHTHSLLKFFLLSLQYFTFSGHPFSLLHSLFPLRPSCSFLLSV